MNRRIDETPSARPRTDSSQESFYASQLGNARAVRYVSTEEFTNDFINSVRDDKSSAFQRRSLGDPSRREWVALPMPVALAPDETDSV